MLDFAETVSLSFDGDGFWQDLVGVDYLSKNQPFWDLTLLMKNERIIKIKIISENKNWK